MTEIDKYWNRELNFFHKKKENSFCFSCGVFNFYGQKCKNNIELDLVAKGNYKNVRFIISYKNGELKSRITNGSKEFYYQPKDIFQHLEDILTLTMGQYLSKPRGFLLANIDKCSKIYENAFEYILDNNINAFISLRTNKIIVEKTYFREKSRLEYAYTSRTPLYDVIYFITNWLNQMECTL